MKRLKVYGIGWMGRYRRVVAAPSQKEAARLIGTTLSHFRAYGCETGNDEEIKVAMREPSVVWQRRSHGHDEWSRA